MCTTRVFCKTVDVKEIQGYVKVVYEKSGQKSIPMKSM